ncbi:MAG: adenylate/guanylate cyclase domain-containing protein, partial [Pseudomonadota bacterium]
FRFGSFIYFFVILAGLAYVYQPKLVVWGGISAAVSWTVGVLWLLSLPDTVWEQTEQSSVESISNLIAQPTFIDVGVRIQEVAVFLIAAGILALAVRRSRTIAKRQARLAGERENLGRYFPRKTAQMLAERTDPFSEPSEQNCAVLFADLVAFTKWSEKHSPGETIDLLRQVHGLLASIVFRNDGTLDKFIGDGVMATFGTPDATDRDASNALRAVTEIVTEFEGLKERGDNQLFADLEIAAGVHYGPIVLGNVGSSERLEFAVLGDTVNIASRLESATREVGCRALASAALVNAAISEGCSDMSEIEKDLVPHGSLSVRGRTGKIEVFKFQ